MTNYEKIINEMTVEKLADILSLTPSACLMCVLHYECWPGSNCRDGIESWLKQDAKDEIADS